MQVLLDQFASIPCLSHDKIEQKLRARGYEPILPAHITSAIMQNRSVPNRYHLVFLAIRDMLSAKPLRDDVDIIWRTEVAQGTAIGFLNKAQLYPYRKQLETHGIIVDNFWQDRSELALPLTSIYVCGERDTMVPSGSFAIFTVWRRADEVRLVAHMLGSGNLANLGDFLKSFRKVAGKIVGKADWSPRIGVLTRDTHLSSALKMAFPKSDIRFPIYAIARELLSISVNFPALSEEQIAALWTIARTAPDVDGIQDLPWLAILPTDLTVAIRGCLEEWWVLRDGWRGSKGRRYFPSMAKMAWADRYLAVFQRSHSPAFAPVLLLAMVGYKLTDSALAGFANWHKGGVTVSGDILRISVSKGNRVHIHNIGVDGNCHCGYEDCDHSWSARFHLSAARPPETFQYGPLRPQAGSSTSTGHADLDLVTLLKPVDDLPTMPTPSVGMPVAVARSSEDLANSFRKIDLKTRAMDRSILPLTAFTAVVQIFRHEELVQDLIKKAVNSTSFTDHDCHIAGLLTGLYPPEALSLLEAKPNVPQSIAYLASRLDGIVATGDECTAFLTTHFQQERYCESCHMTTFDRPSSTQAMLLPQRSDSFSTAVKQWERHWLAGVSCPHCGLKHDEATFEATRHITVVPLILMVQHFSEPIIEFSSAAYGLAHCIYTDGSSSSRIENEWWHFGDKVNKLPYEGDVPQTPHLKVSYGIYRQIIENQDSEHPAVMPVIRVPESLPIPVIPEVLQSREDKERASETIPIPVAPKDHDTRKGEDGSVMPAPPTPESLQMPDFAPAQAAPSVQISLPDSPSYEMDGFDETELSNIFRNMDSVGAGSAAIQSHPWDLALQAMRSAHANDADLPLEEAQAVFQKAWREFHPYAPKYLVNSTGAGLGNVLVFNFTTPSMDRKINWKGIKQHLNIWKASKHEDSIARLPFQTMALDNPKGEFGIPFESDLSEYILPGRWYSDEAIGFFASVLGRGEIPPKARLIKQALVCTSTDLAGCNNLTLIRDNAKRVWRNTIGNDLGDLDRVVAWIRYSQHYTCITIHPPSKIIRYYDPLKVALEDADVIALRKLIHGILNTGDWKWEIPRDRVRQTNAHDCGPILCLNLRFGLAADSPISWNRTDLKSQVPSARAAEQLRYFLYLWMGKTRYLLGKVMDTAMADSEGYVPLKFAKPILPKEATI